MNSLGHIIATNARLQPGNAAEEPHWARDRCAPAKQPGPWTVETLAAAWMAGEHEPESAAWGAYITEVRELFLELRVSRKHFLRFSRSEPYTKLEGLLYDAHKPGDFMVRDDTGIIWAPGHPLRKSVIDRGGLGGFDCRTPITFNGMARYVHDILAHANPQIGMADWKQEYLAYLAEAKHYTPEARPALFAEVVGQAAFYEVHGTHPPVQKCAVLDPAQGVVI